MKEDCPKCFTLVTREVVREVPMGNVKTNVVQVRCPCCGKSYTDYDVAFSASDVKARMERERASNKQAQRALWQRKKAQKKQGFFRRIIAGRQARV